MNYEEFDDGLLDESLFDEDFSCEDCGEDLIECECEEVCDCDEECECEEI